MSIKLLLGALFVLFFPLVYKWTNGYPLGAIEFGVAMIVGAVLLVGSFVVGRLDALIKRRESL